MEVNRCYKSLAFVVVVTSLSFCFLFAQIFPSDLHAGETDECGDALTLSSYEPIAVPSVLRGFGRSELRITDRNKQQLFVGRNIIINEIADELIGHPEFTGPEYDRFTISFLVDEQIKAIGLSIQKNDVLMSKYSYSHSYSLSSSLAGELKTVLEQIPKNLLAKVNNIAILFTTQETSEEELEMYKRWRRHKRDVSMHMDIVKMSETHHSPGMDEIIIRLPSVIPPGSEEEDSLSPSPLKEFHSEILDVIVPHQLGHIMAYHRYGEFTPDQEWHNAILTDNASISEYGDTNIAEDFAEAMVLYLSIDRRFLHPRTQGRYAHRMDILDEIMGLDSSQRRQIEERNREIDHLFKQLNLPIEGIGNTDEENPIELRRLLIEEPRHLALVKTLIDKVSTLHRNKPLDFPPTNESSVRENLIRRLFCYGLYYLTYHLSSRSLADKHFYGKRKRKKRRFSFIPNTIRSLNRLSVSEMEHLLHVFDQVSANRLSYFIYKYIDQALRFFNRHSFPQELYELNEPPLLHSVISETFHLQDVLSNFDMEIYLNTLKEAANIFIEEYKKHDEREIDGDEEAGDGFIKEDREDIKKKAFFWKIVERILNETSTGTRIRKALRQEARYWSLDYVV